MNTITPNQKFLQQINSMSPTEALRKYLAHGKSVFPVGPDKRPLVRWKTYQTNIALPCEADKWIKLWPDMAIGFPTGAYNEYNVLDADTWKAEDWLRDNAPPTTMIQLTRKGTHRFYRLGAFKVPTVKGIGPLPGIDARGEGGYVVISPSTIAGHKYEWLPGAGRATPPPLDALGQAFFTPAGTSPAQGPRKRAHRAEKGSNGADNGPQRYNADGLMYDGREDHITRVTMGMVSTFLRDYGYLPDPEFIAEEMWRICQKVMDLRDGKYSYDYCVEKARSAIEGVRTGRIPVYPDIPEDEKGFGKW